jgi:FkbM family methyltransferase
MYYFLFWGTYKPLEIELLEREIKKGDIVLDIGAHIGSYTLITSKLVGENGRIYSFEPDPNNFALLRKNVVINGCKNVTLVQKAVSNKSGKIRLHLNEDNIGDHRIYNSQDGRRSIEVESVQLDDYFGGQDVNISFIKMDIQGAEGWALEGMHGLLGRNKNVKILTEFWPFGLEKSGFGAKKYIDQLVKYGFKLYQLNEGEKKIEPVRRWKLLEKGGDLYCVRGDHECFLR